MSLLIFAILLIALNIFGYYRSYDIHRYELEEDYINEVYSLIDFDTLELEGFNTYYLDNPVYTEEDAIKVYNTMILDLSRPMNKVLNSNLHIYYDEQENAYALCNDINLYSASLEIYIVVGSNEVKYFTGFSII